MRILFFLLLGWSSFAGAQVDPSVEWKMIEQENAIWIYDSRQKDLVSQYALSFKKVRPLLQKLFVELPEKTTFVISDFTDSPNGSATVFPYPLITIYPVIPLPTSQIGETDDSFFEILCHEYTHILNMHPVHGGMYGLHLIFGSLIHPNQLLPRWYVEGLAVFSETYYNSKGGRLRSQSFEGTVRAITRANQWAQYPIDELNEFIPDWLGGRRAYLLGGAMMEHIAEIKSVEELHLLNQSGSRHLPFFISSLLKKHTGFDADELREATFKKLEQRANRQIQTLQTQPLSMGTLLPTSGNNHFYPRLSPDQKYLAAITGQHNIPSKITIYSRDHEGNFKNILQNLSLPTDTFGLEHLAWSPDSKIIAFNLIQNWKYFYQYSDLFFYNLENNSYQQITFGARVGDLIFSTDGSKIFFVQHLPGSKQLSQIDLVTKTISTLYKPPRLGTNIWSLSLKENSLYFIEQNNEKRQLQSYDLNTQKVQLISDKNTPNSIRWTSQGWIASSPESGVDNLYLFPEIHSPEHHSITNSLTRIIDGELDSQTGALIYSEQRDNGMFLFASPQEQWKKITTAPPVEPLLKMPSPSSNEPHYLDTSATENESTTLLFTSEEKNFSPWRYMKPRYWMPYGYVLDGGFGFQGSTTMADPLGKNSISLLAEWDTLTKKTGGIVSYTNRSTPVALSVLGSQVYRYIYGSKTTLKDSGVNLAARSYIPGLNYKWQMGLEMNSFTTEMAGGRLSRSGPALYLSYANARQRGYDISPPQGESFSLVHQSFIKSWGNVGFEKTNFSGRYYFSKWLPSRHVLFTQVNATYAPNLHQSILYTSTIGGNFVTNTLVPPFLMRGYLSGSLLGRNVGSANIEYRFPIANVYSGWKTFPFFIKQLSGSFVADTISLDGARWSESANSFVKSNFGQWYLGYGAEVQMSCTMGYYLPISFTFGVYHGNTRDITKNNFTTFFSFTL